MTYERVFTAEKNYHQSVDKAKNKSWNCNKSFILPFGCFNDCVNTSVNDCNLIINLRETQY